jgi:RNA polymerase sigma-70 factor, ECF subfamily
MSAVRQPAGAGPDDAALLAAIARGELESLGRLFDRHEPDLCRYLGRLGVSAADADDLIQATFLEVVRAAARFDPALPARAWLMGIATMMVRRHRRSLARTMARLSAWASLPREGAPPTPAEALESDQAARRLQRAFDGLSQKKREVFVLVTLEGMSGDQVARALAIPISTVWTRLHHARRELLDALGGEA